MGPRNQRTVRSVVKSFLEIAVQRNSFSREPVFGRQLDSEGDQNMPLWYKDCLELKKFEKWQTQGRLPLICLKAGHKLPFAKVT